jgi:NitT/TauT family transport system permease protein
MKKALRYGLIFVIIIFIWKIAEQFLPELFVPKLETMWSTFKAMCENGLLPKSAWASFQRITIASFFAFICSFIVAMASFNIKFIHNLSKPLTNFLRFLPITAFYPLLILWLGIDETMKVTFLFLAISFSLSPSFLNIIESIENRYLDTALTMGAKHGAITMHVVLPLTLPQLLQSYIMSYAVGWTYVILAENTNTVHGLGHLMNIGAARGRTDIVMVGLFTIVIISVIFDSLCKLILRNIFKWYYATIKGD